jgi:hypothetical protein
MTVCVQELQPELKQTTRLTSTTAPTTALMLKLFLEILCESLLLMPGGHTTDIFIVTTALFSFVKSKTDLAWPMSA